MPSQEWMKIIYIRRKKLKELVIINYCSILLLATLFIQQISGGLTNSFVNNTRKSKSKSTSQNEDNSSNSEINWEEISQFYMDNLPHHRDKRFIWMTTEKRLVLPPGTQLVLTPTLAMPLMRYPPQGLDANITISTPFTIGFDAMGLTDNANPFGLMPFLNPGLGFFGKRRKRDLPEPEIEPNEIPGGERVILYEAAEDLLFKFGINGKSCLLRAICEMHESPLIGYGFFGEVLRLFLTASKSPYSKRLQDYIEAETTGKIDGECCKYYKDCPNSLFNVKNKYSKEAQENFANKISRKSIMKL